MKKVLPLFMIGLAIGSGASAQGQLGQLLRSSSGGTGLVSLESSSTGNKTFTFSGPSGTVITSHLSTVNLLTGAAGGTVSINGTAGTANFTLTSLGGTAKTAIPSGYDRILLTNSSGLVDAVRISDVVSGSSWALSGNATASAWNGTAGSYLGTSSAQPLVLATTNATAQAIRFYTGANGASQRMIINSDGNVSIGTTAVASTFSVGSGATANFTVNGANGNTSVGGTLSVGSTASVTGAATFGSTASVTGLLTASGGATVTGATSVTGAASINTTGAAATNIGNGSSTTTISGVSLNLTGVTNGTSADSILLIGGTSVKKIAFSAAAGSVAVSEQSLATAYALQTSDYMISCTNAAAGTVTLPTPSAIGKVYVVKSSAAGDVTVNRTGSDTIDGQNSYLIPGGAGLDITFVYVATGKWAVLD